jgi:hypothetical protein
LRLSRAPAAALAVAFACAIAGCGEEDLIDDRLTSVEQIRSLVDQFKRASAEGDDEACALMDQQMQGNSRVAAPIGEARPDCSLVGASFFERELSSLPDAATVYIRRSRHDDGADVQLDNGTRLQLGRIGTNADGEWRVSSHGFRPSPQEWSDRKYENHVQPE